MTYIHALFAAALLAPATAHAQDVASVEVLPGWETAQGTHMAALRLTLAPGWKTYWRAPGDAGIPPQITITDGNVQSVAFHWPTPEVFDQNGMRSIGYHDSLTLPIEVTGSGDLRLTGTLDIGVCLDICIPAQLHFDAPLTDGGRDPAIVGALLNQPQSSGTATCRVTPTDNGLHLEAVLTLPTTGTQEALVVEAGDPHIWVSEPVIARQGNTVTAQAELVRGAGDAFAFDRSAVRFTLLGSDRAVQVQGCTAG
ncbi:MAG: DsbC/DsbD-like thiol-disulfide interchange protein [Loktanella salsilacus]|jgi:DsbC/DsbD-like thiol-disulfide interchange protein|uniref:protein-disulfide reductase DsbD domain-containing protein n=1 Tax=Loktanella salsilacus TaxID=195913 RepID=UPI003989ED9A